MDHHAPRQFDLESVMLEAHRVFELGIGRAREIFSVTGAPCNKASALLARQGLCATPPNARRTFFTVPPSTSSAAASDTSAKA